MRVTSAAARFLLNEMGCRSFETELFPANKEILSGTDFLLPMLKYFMRLLVDSEIKQPTIGQSLIKAMKAKSVIPPLLFGLGVEIDHIVGSKILIIELAKLGFSIRYDEVNRFKQSALHKKMKFSIKDFFNKCDQIRRKLWIWSHLLKKSVMENFIFCAVQLQFNPNQKTKKMFLLLFPNGLR